MPRNKRPLTSLVLLQAKSGDEGVIEGYASVFNVDDGQAAFIAPGAFTKTLQEKTKIKVLWGHDTNEVIGLVQEASQDEKGLYVSIKLNLDVQRAQEVYSNIKFGALDSFSIGAYVIKDRYDDKTGRYEILEAALFEISVVSFPANVQAKITKVQSEFDDISEKTIQKITEIVQTAITKMLNKNNEDAANDLLTQLEKELAEEEAAFENALLAEMQAEEQELADFLGLSEAAEPEEAEEPVLTSDTPVTEEAATEPNSEPQGAEAELEAELAALEAEFDELLGLS